MNVTSRMCGVNPSAPLSESKLRDRLQDNPPVFFGLRRKSIIFSGCGAQTASLGYHGDERLKDEGPWDPSSTGIY
eukprot:77935-Amorphochlora_amoeboformis.AAC.2